MQLRQLRYLFAVAEERRFARAADRLHISAPSLAQQIQALERELRVTLFDRTPQRVDLTPGGETLLTRARVIVAEADRARDEVRAAEAGRRDKLALRICNMAELVLHRPLHVAALGLRVSRSPSPRARGTMPSRPSVRHGRTPPSSGADRTTSGTSRVRCLIAAAEDPHSLITAAPSGRAAAGLGGVPVPRERLSPDGGDGPAGKASISDP